MTMKKILVPTDFSQPAQWALETAIGIARKTKADIILLHVIEQPMELSFNAEEQIAGYSNQEEKRYVLELINKGKNLLEEAERSVKTSEVIIYTQLKIGNPFHGIRSIISAFKADLVVMGTSGRTKIEEALIGSNTERVVRYSKRPVFSVHEKPTTTEYKNIVYATSLNEGERSFIEIVKLMQETYYATLHLVRVNTPMEFQPDHEVKKEMANFVAKMNLTNYTLNVFSDYEEEEGILHFASGIKADAIAMASRKRTGFSSVLSRSITEDVINHSSMPVLTYVINSN